MINWIEYTVDNIIKHDVQNRKNDFVYLDAHNLINFSKNILTTHFAFKKSYEEILPQKKGKS